MRRGIWSRPHHIKTRETAVRMQWTPAGIHQWPSFPQTQPKNRRLKQDYLRIVSRAWREMETTKWRRRDQRFSRSKQWEGRSRIKLKDLIRNNKNWTALLIWVDPSSTRRTRTSQTIRALASTESKTLTNSHSSSPSKRTQGCWTWVAVSKSTWGNFSHLESESPQKRRAWHHPTSKMGQLCPQRSREIAMSWKNLLQLFSKLPLLIKRVIALYPRFNNQNLNLWTQKRNQLAKARSINHNWLRMGRVRWMRVSSTTTSTTRW